MKRVCDQRYQYARVRRKKRRLRKRLIRRITILGIGCIGIILVVMLWNQIFFENFENIFFEEQTVSQREFKYEDIGEWKLILVNRWNLIPEDYEVELTYLQNDQAVDSRIYPELQKMFDDARAAGYDPYINSSYRTKEKQEFLMEEEIQKYLAEGYSEKKAKKVAEQWVNIPGTSEHQLGLAVDISMNSEEKYEMWQWLYENSYKYGFVLRYPEEKEKITGVNYEPWHFRYVGGEAAKEIYEKNICLEEYLDDK